jgi:hypoxanthine phosphoribosyltransferase
MKKQIITYPEYQSYISKICVDISASEWMPDYIVGITRGGSFPAVLISQYFNRPCEMLKVSLREHPSTECNAWMSEDAFGYEQPRKNILIVDDINDTGATINWIINDWQSSCLPNNNEWNNIWNHNVKFAVVANKEDSGCCVKMDYVGFNISKDDRDIWIEFPYENWWVK